MEKAFVKSTAKLEFLDRTACEYAFILFLRRYVAILKPFTQWRSTTQLSEVFFSFVDNV